MKRNSFLNYINTTSVTSLYAVTLFVLWLGISPAIFKNIFSITTQVDPVPFASILPSNNPRNVYKVVKKGKPAKLSIPSLQIEKDIVDGEYNAESRSWNVGKSSVHFAVPTKIANNIEGNTLLYGHNNKEVFGPLTNLSPGSLVKITTDNNKEFTYIFRDVQDFIPTDTSILTYSGPPILTLQTCSGSFNEIRSVYIFELESVVDVANV